LSVQADPLEKVKVAITIQLPLPMRRELEARALAADRSLGAEIRLACRRHLDEFRQGA
jgi:hypothetical protein